MRSCPERRKYMQAYIVGKPDSSGAESSKRQFSTLAKGCGKSVGPCAGGTDEGSFTSNVQIRGPWSSARIPLPSSPQACEARSVFPVHMGKLRLQRAPCRAGMQEGLSRGLSGPCLLHADAARTLKGSHCTPPPPLWSSQVWLLENNLDFAS